LHDTTPENVVVGLQGAVLVLKIGSSRAGTCRSREGRLWVKTNSPIVTQLSIVTNHYKNLETVSTGKVKKLNRHQFLALSPAMPQLLCFGHVLPSPRTLNKHCEASVRDDL
jgi:hypothetical protein